MRSIHLGAYLLLELVILLLAPPDNALQAGDPLPHHADQALSFRLCSLALSGYLVHKLMQLRDSGPPVAYI